MLPALVVALASCGSGDGPGLAAGGGGALLPNFTSIQDQVFTPLCVSCHSGATAPLGMRLDAANSFALLVGVASQQEPAFMRVDPGDPNASYLIRKLEGTASTGGRMPLNGVPLPQSDIDVIRQWIADGALPGGGPPPSTPIRVTSLNPLPGSSVPMLPLSIMAVFDRELVASSVDATTFLVERSGGDGSFGDGNEVSIVPVSVTVPQANPLTAVFDMSSTMPVEDSYRVTLIGSGPATIQDLDANALDGEFSGSFPSGDDTAGGNFVADFEVAGIQPTLQSIQDNVFTPICSACHSGPSSNDVLDLPGGMPLTDLGTSFAELVGITSLEDANFERVDVGDPDNSYLIQKLEGNAAAGGIMPPFGGPLDQDTIDTIRQWIADGATM